LTENPTTNSSPKDLGEKSSFFPLTHSDKYFKKCKISLLALVRILQHAKKGGDIEVMGTFVGKIIGDTFIVMDAYPLPVEGTETRVNAGREAEEYTGRIQDLSESVSFSFTFS